MPSKKNRSCLIRSVLPEERRATFVASTETGIPCYEGKEYLVMRGCNLARYRSNPVLLDSHNAYQVGAVIGSADVRIEGSDKGDILVADVTFADSTQRAKDAWNLVKDGFVRALSIGFRVERKAKVTLEQGAAYEKDERMTGPGVVYPRWELLEISVVPVPADMHALIRRHLRRKRMVKVCAERLQAAVSAACAKGVTFEGLTSDLSEQGEMELERAASILAGKEAEIGEEDAEVLRSLVGSDFEEKEGPPVGTPRKGPDDAAVRVIRAIAPRGLEALADQLILEGKTVDESRSAFLAELAKKAPPAKSPDTSYRGPSGQSVTNDVLFRTLCNL